MLIGFVMSNRFRCRANEFRNFNAQTMADASADTVLLWRFHLLISCKYMKNFMAVFFHSQNYYYIMYFNSRNLTVCIAPFCLQWQACTENIYNGCPANAAAELSYDHAQSWDLFSLVLQCSIVPHCALEVLRECTLEIDILFTYSLLIYHEWSCYCSADRPLLCCWCRWSMTNNRLSFAVLYFTVSSHSSTKTILDSLRLSRRCCRPLLKVCIYSL